MKPALNVLAAALAVGGAATHFLYDSIWGGAAVLMSLVLKIAIDLSGHNTRSLWLMVPIGMAVAFIWGLNLGRVVSSG